MLVDRIMQIVPRQLFWAVALVLFITSGNAQGQLTVYRQNGVYHLHNHGKNRDVSENSSASRIIQTAIDKLGKSGGKITLSRGSYELDETLIIKTGIILSGQGRATELKGGKELDFLVHLHDVERAELSWIALTPGNMGDGGGISVHDASDCKIVNATIFGFKEFGIKVSGGHDGLEIYRCRFTNNGRANVFLGKSNEHAGTATIKDCIFLWGGSGVMAREASGVKIRSSVIYHTNGLPMDIHCNDFSVTGTRIFIGESDEAALKYSGDGFEIRNNIMGWVRGHGYIIEKANNGLIRANCIIDLGPPPRDGIFKSGIVLRKSENVKILANAIWNWDDWTQGPMEYGIDEGPECDNNHFENNNIHFYRVAPVRIQDNNTVIRNNVSDPGRDDERPLMDFNVWRDYVEALIRDEISGEIDNLDDMEDFTVQPSGEKFEVLTSATGKSVFTSSEASEAIQWAIDQSGSGGGIELSEGTFPLISSLKIPGNIWFHGSGEKTILKASNNMENALVLDQAYNTSISDFVLEQAAGAKTGVLLNNSIFTQIQNITVIGFSRYGLYFNPDRENAPPNTWNGTAGPALILVSESRFIDNGQVNIHKPVCGAYIGNAVPTMMTRNITRGGQMGIYCEGICDNIVGNIVLQAGQHAYVLNANSILCSGNMAYQTRGTAIQVFDGKINHSQNYDRNDNNNNKESNLTSNYLIYQQGTGIEMSEQWGTMTDNRIVNSGVGVGYKSGIWLHEDSESYAVVDNLIFNDEEHFPLLNGITEYGVKNLIAGNRIQNYSVKAVQSKGEATLVTGNTGIAARKVQEGIGWAEDDKLDWNLPYQELRDYLEKLCEKKAMH
jgi:hypothetical protein